MNGIVLLEKGEGRELLKRKCREIGIPIGIVEQLVSAEFELAGKRNKNGLTDKFDEILGGLSDEPAGD